MICRVSWMAIIDDNGISRVCYFTFWTYGFVMRAFNHLLSA